MTIFSLFHKLLFSLNFYHYKIPREQLERERRERQSRNTYYTRDDRPPQALGKQRFFVCFFIIIFSPSEFTAKRDLPLRRYEPQSLARWKCSSDYLQSVTVSAYYRHPQSRL